jgi:hypothetical protein
MEFKACEECTEIKVSELSNGGSHFELFLKEDSKLKELLKEKYKDAEIIPLDVAKELKGIWGGNMITFHT